LLAVKVAFGRTHHQGRTGFWLAPDRAQFGFVGWRFIVQST
jgi:hypothetical protein